MDNDLNTISLYLSAGMYLQSSVYHRLNHIFVDRFCDLTQDHQ